MTAFTQWFQSESGRRILVWASGALSLAIQGGLIPLDMAIGPWSVGQLLAFFGLGVAATSGSSTRA